MSIFTYWAAILVFFYNCGFSCVWGVFLLMWSFSFLLLSRNDSAGRFGFCYWRFKWRRGEERLLANGYSEHWPPPTREASLPHGRWVRFFVQTNIYYKWVALVPFNHSLWCLHVLQVCCRPGCMRGFGVWYVWLRVSDPHCSKCSASCAKRQIKKYIYLYIYIFLACFYQRFGSALVPWGSLQVKQKQYAKDFLPIDPDCHCPTCKR